MSPSQFVHRLNAIHHGFGDAAAAFEEYGKGTPVPVCLLMAAMGRVICDEVDRLGDEVLCQVFHVIELALLEGDVVTKDAVATCLLENLQNYGSTGAFDFSRIAPLLGREARAYCRAWDGFAGVRSAGL